MTSSVVIAVKWKYTWGSLNLPTAQTFVSLHFCGKVLSEVIAGTGHLPTANEVELCLLKS